MAELPTPEDSARKLLAIFNRNGCKPGEILMQGVFLAQSGHVGLDTRDIKDALIYAGNAGWVENGPNNSIRLTEAGFKAM